MEEESEGMFSSQQSVDYVGRLEDERRWRRLTRIP